MWLISNFFGYFTAIILGSAVVAIFSRRFQNFLYALRVKNFISSLKILEITNGLQSQEACMYLRSHCRDLPVLGFDCEWVTEGGKHKPVALLQLATVHGLCCLFRLNVLGTIHNELAELLEDSSIIKLGVSPLNDSKRLKQDYNVQVCSTLDLRHLYPTGGGLGSLAASQIGVKLDKSWRLKCSNWEALNLTDSQRDYAAKDALVAVGIFKKWIFTKNKTFNLFNAKVNYNCLFNEDLKLEISRYLDINFKATNVFPSAKFDKTTISPQGLSQKLAGHHVTRKSPLYHNCFMHAPDGELLCSCSERKAQWYLSRGLAKELPGEPYSIRLLFEPAARAGETAEGRFYQQLKQNCCVVCGEEKSYLKHNVVPKEYRRHFPNIIKDHQSHDIVLMCLRCHQLAAQYKENFRQKLAVLCDAPIKSSTVTQSKIIRKVKDSAKALLNAGHIIPEERRIYLENEVKQHYKVDTLTPGLLAEAANLKAQIIHKNYESHGIKVVNYFVQSGNDGLTKLQILWREHFIDTMKPQHLPALWSVNHKNLRLSAKANEKQV